MTCTAGIAADVAVKQTLCSTALASRAVSGAEPSLWDTRSGEETLWLSVWISRYVSVGMLRLFYVTSHYCALSILFCACCASSACKNSSAGLVPRKSL